MKAKGFYCKSNETTGRLQVYDFEGGTKTPIKDPIEGCDKFQKILAQIDQGIWPVVEE